MKSVTVHLDEKIYRDFQQQARKQSRTASELIREAMEQYRQRLKPARAPLSESPAPASVGRVRQTWSSRAELLDDFFS
jgi:predicted transcriptional regulator